MQLKNSNNFKTELQMIELTKKSLAKRGIFLLMIVLKKNAHRERVRTTDKTY